MFGSNPGEERFQGALNQLVISKLVSVKTTYWVIHTKGEDATSVLISALSQVKTPLKQLHDLISAITKRHTLNSDEWNALPPTDVTKWGSPSERISLHFAVTNDYFTSRVIGYQIEDTK